MSRRPASSATATGRAGVTAEITRAIAAEARANPGTRFDLLHRCGLTLLVRAAPFRPR